MSGKGKFIWCVILVIGTWKASAYMHQHDLAAELHAQFSSQEYAGSSERMWHGVTPIGIRNAKRIMVYMALAGAAGYWLIGKYRERCDRLYVHDNRGAFAQQLAAARKLAEHGAVTEMVRGSLAEREGALRKILDRIEADKVDWPSVRRAMETWHGRFQLMAEVAQRQAACAVSGDNAARGGARGS